MSDCAILFIGFILGFLVCDAIFITIILLSVQKTLDDISDFFDI